MKDSSDSFSFSLSRVEAKQLALAIYVLGEHIAAGEPIPSMGHDFDEIVGGVYKRLKIALKEDGS